MKVILINKMNEEMIEKGYSVECGFADNKKHFDHHGEYASFASPCINTTIPIITNETIYVSHIDADSFIGINRLLGKEIPSNLDLSLMQEIDLNGSSVVSNKFNPTLLYMVGVGQKTREYKFPRVTSEPQDITSIIMDLLKLSTEEFIEAGRIATEKSEKAYTECLIKKQGNKALYSIGANDPLDPSRPYEDDIDIVVVYRQHWKTISIYCNPKSQYAFGGSIVANIEFGGHPKACGSPRGVEMSLEQAISVFEAI